jgi:hypothetical protein
MDVSPLLLIRQKLQLISKKPLIKACFIFLLGFCFFGMGIFIFFSTHLLSIDENRVFGDKDGNFSLDYVLSNCDFDVILFEMEKADGFFRVIKENVYSKIKDSVYYYLFLFKVLFKC